ncbi:restriction endonuclease [Halobellus rubicundus]|uniref:Restriction endonuclease n=1 Tax=Halobellus rubicundus TaxID=2996466 RepID=A0ABD5MD26_9EURY
MIPELEPDEFVSFLGDLWRERGWNVSMKERADETHFVIGKRGDGKRGVIYVFPTTTATVTERHLKQFVTFCRKRGIDVAVVATQGAFAEGAQRIAGQRGVHLLDRETLETTVSEGGFDDLLAQYTETTGLAAVFERLRDVGVPVPEGLEDRLPDVGAAVAGLRAKVGLTAEGSGDESDGGDGGGTDGDPGDRSRLDQVTDRLGGIASGSVPAGVVPVVLVVAFLIGATIGPAVGLGGGLLGSGGDAGPGVSAMSTAGANATVDARWNAETRDGLSVNGTSFEPPDGQTFLLVRLNVTNGGDSPIQLQQSAFAVEVAGQRYGRQPLDGVTGFPSAGLFEPDESREVWLVFSVPADAESATLVYDGELMLRFERDSAITPEATVPDDG